MIMGFTNLCLPGGKPKNDQWESIIKKRALQGYVVPKVQVNIYVYVKKMCLYKN